MGLLVSGGGAGAAVDFAREILPVLSDACFACHGPDSGARKAGLRLDTPDGARGGGRSGERAIVPGHVERSELWRRIVSGDPDDVMPPPESNRRLSAAQRDRIRAWIEEGAPWGRHWAYEPPQRPVPPVSGGGMAGVRNAVDAFVATRLREEGWVAAPEAPRETLLRRVSLDLTGLPPTPEEVAAFVQDPDPAAYERQVDRLLASPRLGERLAWDWLEAARYADSNGYQGDSERTMWPWRDWVISAFNRNLPFDTFTLWQIAGDLMPEAPREATLATGFLRNHMINGEGGRIPEENRVDYLFDQAETVATVWLAATYNCTRCHDHKYDPHTQRDYFSLVAFFNRTAVDGSGGNPQTPPVLEMPDDVQVARRELLEAERSAAVAATTAAEALKFAGESGPDGSEGPDSAELPREILEVLKAFPGGRDVSKLEKLATHFRESDPDYASVIERQREAQAAMDALARSIPRVMVMADVASPRPTFVLNRGSYLEPTTEVDVALPSALATTGTLSVSNRLGLARWLVSPGNPLTARVAVNRWWQALFGTGLVKTSEDFGVQGEHPSHPELLDWLACEFMESGWDVKRLLRLLVTSGTYRQSSVVPPVLAAQDPENRLLARGPRFRMPSWMIRDVALAASGLLAETAGGPAVKPYQPPGIWEEATFGNKRYEQDHGAALYRRSVYVFWRRIVGPTMFFDVASRQTCTVRTPRTNVPLHALLTLNDIAHLEAARVLSSVLLEGKDPDDSGRLAAACRRVLGRGPTTEEFDVLQRGLDRHRGTFRRDPEAAAALVAVGESPGVPDLEAPEHAAWMLLCSTLLNLDEALTKE